MLKQVRFINWKSFADATLYIDPLTIVIGTNASGKSNLVEGLEFLARMTRGAELEHALAGGGNSKFTPLRGGIEWAARSGSTKFTIEAIIENIQKNDSTYKLEIQTSPEIHLLRELLHVDGANHSSIQFTRPIKQPSIKDLVNHDQPIVDLPPEHRFLTKRDYWIHAFSINLMNRTTPSFEMKQTLLSLFHLFEEDKVSQASPETQTFNDLHNIFVLTPDVGRIRSYQYFSQQLEQDAGNLAGVLAKMPEDQQQEILNTITSYLKDLPDYQISRVFLEKVGLQGIEAMLCCEEKWGDQLLQIDARCMSDGVLRFIAILTALLTRPQGSLLVIEDVDLGFHPSRVELLLKALRTEGAKRKIDLVVTTHNEALLDSLAIDMLPFVTVAYRDPSSGDSKLIPLDQVEALAKIVAAGPLGKAVSRRIVEEAIRYQEQKK